MKAVLIAGVVAAAIGAVVTTVVARTGPDQEAPRPIVLFLHGRGQIGRDTADVRREWQGALETGISKLTNRSLLDPMDVRLVWYADVLDPTSSVAGCETDTTARRSPATEGDDALALLLGVTSTLFTALYESLPTESRSTMRMLVGDALYLGDRWRRCGVDRRLETALANAARSRRPVILVAHSFGSLVAYSYLRRDRSTPHARAVHRFVTLGSMLGIPELQQLLLGRTGALSLPAGVGSWINVRHVRDPFAPSLTDTVSSGHRAKIVREVMTRGDVIDPHDIVMYLRDPATARAIAWAWCDAGGSSHEPACRDIDHDVP